jgi:hypothetical protein
MSQTKPPNPLAILGFTPESLDGLDDHQIKRLVGERSRVLSALFHPDTNKEPGAEGRFKEIQRASNELSIDITFEEARRAFLRKPNKTDKGRLTEDVRSEQKAYEFALSSFLSGLAEPHLAKVEPRPIVGFCEPPPCLVLLNDIMPFVTLARAGGHKATRLRDKLGLKRLKRPKTFELEIRPDGSMFTCDLEIVQFDDREESPPAGIPEEWITLRGNHFDCFYFRRTGPAAPFEDKLIGSIHIQQYKWDLGPESLEWTKGFVPGDPDTGDYERAIEGYPFELLLRYLPYYKPALFSPGLVLALNLRGREPVYRAIGQANRFHFPGVS